MRLDLPHEFTASLITDPEPATPRLVEEAIRAFDDVQSARGFAAEECVAMERENLNELVALAERQLEELRELRRELERQTVLLERMLETLVSLERSQYS